MDTTKLIQALTDAMIVGRQQIIDAFAVALAQAVFKDGVLTEEQAHRINDAAVEAFKARG